ncbi:hypothetical protein [Streptomyces sp. NPDC060035]|uniref:hypothetical protein n=1 Tax=Streptomyces sp. NPDC060035 TaxID=3347044 RepID=UPI003677E48B
MRPSLPRLVHQPVQPAGHRLRASASPSWRTAAPPSRRTEFRADGARTELPARRLPVGRTG